MNFINIIDLYGYDTVFSGVQVPDGIDTEILINAIMDKCGTSEPIYTDIPLLIQKDQKILIINTGRIYTVISVLRQRRRC